MLKKSLKCVLAPVILLAAMVSLTSFVESGEGSSYGMCRAYLYCSRSGTGVGCYGNDCCGAGDDYVKCDGAIVRCP